MSLHRWLAGPTFCMVVLACIPAHAPDYNHRFQLYVDKQLPLKWIKKGALDWTRVTGYILEIHVIDHDLASVMSLGQNPRDTLVMLDATDLEGTLCQPDVACFKDGTAYFFALKITGDPSSPSTTEHVSSHGEGAMAWKQTEGSWDRVPAHEIGHFLGLNHIENRKSIMRYRTDLQESTPTVEDGLLVNPRAIH